MSGSQDANLLIGILALQLDFTTQEKLFQAFQTWMLDKSKTIDQILLDHDAIDEETRELLLKLVAKHVDRHGKEVQFSIASLCNNHETALMELRSLDDAELNSSLAFLNSGQPERTTNRPSRAGNGSTLGHSSLDASHRFRILRPHAQGGLGMVSVALDQELNREVALKEIRPEHAGYAESRERFILEAEITGGLEHPGIVPVYGLGAHRDGQPFYAMRFIRGDSMKQAARAFHKQPVVKGKKDFQAIEFRRLIRRLIDVCNAMEYAHSRGVLHRDLKPGNIMLGKYGETMVVDWGLAKAVGRAEPDGGSDERTLRPSSGTGVIHTMMGQVIGTPAYMSPEQAAGKNDELTPAADIYSIGATLYYLLTGQSPANSKTSAEVLQTVVSGLIPAADVVEPNAPRALSAICRTAMALKPVDRYQKAISLAHDLEFWLDDQAVSVYREPTLVRLGRTLRKHQTSVASTFVGLTTATFALGAATWLISLKNSDLELARDAAEANRQQAVLAQERSEEDLITARGVAMEMLEMAEFQLSQQPGMALAREALMDRCYGMLAGIRERSGDDTDVESDFAKVARLSGNVKRLMGKHDEGRVRLKQAIEIYQRRYKANHEDFDLGRILAELYRDLGTLERTSDHPVDAEVALETAANLIKPLCLDHPEAEHLLLTQATIHLQLVSPRYDQSRFKEALESATLSAAAYEPLLTAEIVSAQDATQFSLAVDRRMMLLQHFGNFKEARELFDQHLPFVRRCLANEAYRDLKYALGRLLLSATKSNLGLANFSSEADSELDEAIEIFDHLTKVNPQAFGYQYYLGDVWRLRGLFRGKQGKFDEAKVAFDRALSVLEYVNKKFDKASYRDKLAETNADFADFWQQRNDLESAVEYWQKAVDFENQACTKTPDNQNYQKQLTIYEKSLADLKTRQTTPQNIH